jgi:hypothetical protein
MDSNILYGLLKNVAKDLDQGTITFPLINYRTDLTEGAIERSPAPIIMVPSNNRLIYGNAEKNEKVQVLII